MSRLSRILVRTAPRPYPVLIGTNHAASSVRTLLGKAVPRRVPVISSSAVWRHVGARLRPLTGATPPIALPDREKAKTWDRIGQVHDALLRAGLRRNGALVAVGGGSVGDAAGFAAATYMRGVDWIVVPTTLLSMVDSSIGGKVGVNHVRSKNLVGAFHQPRGVVVDLALLGSLPRRELRGGSYEILKCALIGDAPLFDALAQRGSADAWPKALMRRAVEAAIRLKAMVVSRDAREGGLRLVLNLGHTFGHALEAATDYERFNHGEAVGHGLLAAAHISRSRGLLTASALDRLRAAVDALGPRPPLSSIAYDTVRRAMGSDKKALSSRPTFVLPQGIGRVVVRHDITESELRSAWAYLKSMEP